MKFGQTETICDDGTMEQTDIYVTYKGKQSGIFRKHTVDTYVTNVKEETMLYISWSKKIDELRTSRHLYKNPSFPQHFPTFTSYPELTKEGQYLVRTTWTEKIV